MKRTIILKVVAAVLCFALVFACLTALFRPKWNYVGNQAQTRVQAFYRQEENTEEVIYLGASYTYCGISPLQIYQEQGITGYAFCNPMQRAWISADYLEEAFKTQSPKVVVYEVGPAFDEDEADEGHNRKNVDYLKWSKTKLKAIRQIVSHAEGESIKDYLIPFLRYHSRWSDIKKADFNVFYDSSYYLMGTALKMTTRSASDEAIAEYEKGISDGEEAVLGERAKKAMLDMKAMCEEHGASFQLVRMSSMQWSVEKSAAIKAFAEENEIPYVDLNEQQNEVGIDWKTDSHDAGQHVNILGCKKASSYLGKYLTEHYELDTDLSDSVKETWDKASEKWQRLVESYSMPIIDEIEDYAKDMTNSDFVTVFALNGGLGQYLTENQREALKEAGLTLPENGSQEAYIAVLDGDQLVTELYGSDAEAVTNAQTGEISLKACKVGSVTFDVTSSISGGTVNTETGITPLGNVSIKVNGKEYALNRTGLNVVLYDKTLKQPTDVVVFDASQEGVPAEHTAQPLVSDEGGE